jgi:hypothetical protein
VKASIKASDTKPKEKIRVVCFSAERNAAGSAALSPCNLRKGNLTPQQARMFPKQHPFAPAVHRLHRNGRLSPPNYLHDSWLDHLYWDTELDPQARG